MDKRWMTVRHGLFVCALVSLMVSSAITVAAQTATPAPTTGGTFTGKISKTSPLTVNSNGQDRQINPASNVVVTRGGNNATLNDLKAGDQVNVTSNPDNTVSRIEVANTGSAFPAWLIPVIIVLLILALLAYLLSRRRKDNFVLERNEANIPRP